MSSRCRNPVRNRPHLPVSIGIGRGAEPGCVMCMREEACVMIDIKSYQQNAADCMIKAQQEATPEDQNILLNIALAWLRLEQQIEAMNQTDSPSMVPGQDEGADQPAELSSREMTP
jgi:hypothetical protein